MFKILVMCLLLNSAESYKILGIFAHPGRSHFYIFKPLLEALAKKGHEVTVLGHFPSKENLTNYKDLSLAYLGHELANVFPVTAHKRTRTEKLLCLTTLNNMGRFSCESAMSSIEYQTVLKSNAVYDIIIAEYFNTNCLLLPLIEKLKIPFIGISTHVLLPPANDWVGNPDHPAYIPQVLMDYSDKKTFFERVEGTLVWLYQRFYYRYAIEKMEFEMIKKYTGKDEPRFTNLMYNTSLILVSTHFTLNTPRPMVPNVIEVGGIHVRNVEKLPLHIEKWINESTHGVIYFSLGSMIKGHTFPEEKRQMFVSAFSRLPQRIIWKWEADTMPGKPDNIMIEKWLPQFDILCHPNVKAFIAHGGLLGATEAVHCGVPMVIMPQFGDQFTNAKAIEASGGGVILDYSTLSEETIYNALTNVLDESFNNKAKELSARFRDRPLPPLETAIYWVEYVARHKGAPHLRTAAVGMPLYQYLLLDVIAFLATISFCFMFIVYYITRALFRKLFSRKKSSDKVKTN